MKKILFLVLFLGNMLVSMGQVNLPVMYDQHWNLLGSRYIPSKLGNDFPTATLVLANPYAYIGNSGFSMKTVKALDNQAIDKALGQMSSRNILGFGANVDWLAFSYKIKDKDEEKMTFAINASDRFEGNFTYTKDFFDILWNGNKKFEGKKADLTMAFGAHHLREYGLGWSMPLILPSFSSDMKLRVGARLKYLQGFAVVYMPKSSSSLTTTTDGREIRMDGSYEIRTAGVDNYSASKPAGAGLGIDLSGTFELNKNISASMAVLDIGRMKYKKDTRGYYLDNGFKFDGIQILDVIKGGNFDVQNELENIAKGREDSGRSFTTPLPTRLVVQGEYHTVSNTKAKKREYFDKSIYLTYIQGFNNMPGSTTRPFLSAGYVHSFNYVFNAGLTLGLGGYNRTFMGLNGSVRFGGFRLGVGTTNILGVTTLNGSGMDVTFNTAITF